MDNNIKEKKSIGKGIIIVSIIQLLYFLYITFPSLLCLANEDLLKQTSKNAKITESLLKSQIEVTLVISIIIIAGFILIFMKKTIGVYLYILCSAAYIIFSIKYNGFHIVSLILLLVFPVIMITLIYKRKEAFGLNMDKIRK